MPPSSSQAQAPRRPVKVESYWTTIANLFAACCPCFGPRRKHPRNEYERLLDEQEEEVEEQLQDSSTLLRWIALLLSGVYLPSNDQLYAVLYRCSGWIQGIGIAEDGDATLLGPLTGKILNESQLLCKDVARWIASSDAVVAGNRVPNGNSRESLQRLVFHFTRLVRKPPQSPTSDVQVEDVVPEVAQVKAAAEEGAEDLRLSLYSTAQLVISFVTSRQLTNLVRDGLNFGRDMAADAVQAGVDGLAQTENVLRPSEEERNESLQEELTGLKQGTQARVNVAAQLDPYAAKAAVEDLPSTVADSAREKLPSLNGMAEATGRIIGELAEEDPTFKEALQSLVALATKYRDIVKKATEGRVADILPDVERDDASKDKQPPFEWNADVLAIGSALRDLLEGMAGGKSLAPILNEVESLYSAISDDIIKATDEWLSDVQAALTGPPGDGQGTRAGQLQKSLSKLAGSLESIISDRPDLRSKLDLILSLSSTFFAEIKRDPRLIRIASRLQTIALTTYTGLSQQAQSLAQQASKGTAGIMHDVFSYILPALLKTLGNIPLPRLEYTSPQLDAALDDVRIAAFNLVPAKVKVQMTEAFEWNRVAVRSEDQVDATVKQVHVEASGVRLALRGVSFFVREKVTQVSTARWLDKALCGCGKPAQAADDDGEEEEEGHVGAYREQAILDAGLFGRSESNDGASLAIDVSHAAPRTTHSSEDDYDERPPSSPTFFKIDSTALKLSDSFDVRLRKSHHFILNAALVEPVGVPVARMVLESVLSGLVKHGLEVLDHRAGDVHARAVRVAARGVKEHEEQAATPAWGDYVRVLMDVKAGKSQARLEREKKEREEEERKAAAEEAKKKQRQEGGATTSSTQVEVKPLAIIVHLGEDTSLSIGAYPTLLPSYAQGPTTTRTRVRNAVVRNEWQAAVKDRAKDTMEELAEGAAGVKVAAEGVKEGVKGAKDAVQEGRELAGELREVRGEREEIVDEEEEEEEEEEKEPVWYHSGFDL